MIRNTRWTQWSIFALLCLVFLAPPFALAQENEAETIPFDTPLCKYKGKEFTVGYFLTFLGNGIQQLEDIKEEDKRGFLERQLSKMYFDHLVYDMAMEDGQAKDPAFIVGSRNLKHHW
ncbi:hypothetical protein GF373_10135, partial [bacterium]|nr:hypothetical protein [bacterium]